MNLISLLLILVSLTPNLSHAQGHSGAGGGDASASDFQDYINKIDAYLLTDEGKSLFPEIKQPEFHEMIQNVRPVVKDERVYDSFGVAQTCVSHVDASQRYFQCDLQRLPKIDLNNQPSFYRLTFHELLFQAGLELPISANVPSNFEISSRLKYKLATYQEWVPGTETQPTQTKGIFEFDKPKINTYDVANKSNLDQLCKMLVHNDLAMEAGHTHSGQTSSYARPYAKIDREGRKTFFVAYRQSVVSTVSCVVNE